MRESFGGAFMIKLVLIFIVIYITFMAGAISYAKAFRVKNQVINILEQNQYSGKGDDTVIGLIDGYLGTVSYAYPVGEYPDLEKNCKNSSNGKPYTYTLNGACIIDEGERYYKVVTYIAVKLPFFDIAMIIPISGETKTIRT